MGEVVEAEGRAEVEVLLGRVLDAAAQERGEAAAGVVAKSSMLTPSLPRITSFGWYWKNPVAENRSAPLDWIVEIISSFARVALIWSW